MSDCLFDRPSAEPSLPDDLPVGSGPLSGLARDYPAGTCILPHSHPWGQLIHAVTGVMQVTTPQGTWVLPSNRALWVPPTIRHALRMMGDVAMRTIYVTPEAMTLPRDDCKVVIVSPLLRELILPAITGGEDSRLHHVHSLILDEFRLLDAQPLKLTLPEEPRLRRICFALQKEPGRDETLDQWGEIVGASSRTLARLFQQELGLRFQDWRQQARLAEALTRLAQGTAIGTVAQDLGYASQAAFTAMFRRALGCAPRDYLPQGEKS